MALPLHREQCTDQTSTRIMRALKAEVQGPLWNAAAALQEYASKSWLVSPQSYAYQPPYDQSKLGPWPVASYARLEVVEESGEGENEAGNTLRQRVEAAQPERSTDVPGLDHGLSDIGDRYDDATGVKSGESTKRLDTLRLGGSEDHTIRSKQKSRLLQSVAPTVHNSPPAGLLSEAVILAIN